MPLMDLAILEDVLHEVAPDSFDIRFVKDALPGLHNWRVVIGVAPKAGAGSAFSLVDAFQLAVKEYHDACARPKRPATLQIGSNGPKVEILDWHVDLP